MPLALLALFLAAGAAATCRPSWYRPASIDYSRLERDKHAQLQLENQISAALNKGRSIEIELEQSQVNRWIAGRAELWPGEAPSLAPFARPQVEFLRGRRVRVGALWERSGLAVVLSVTLHVELENGVLVISWAAVRVAASGEFAPPGT